MSLMVWDTGDISGVANYMCRPLLPRFTSWDHWGSKYDYDYDYVSEFRHFVHLICTPFPLFTYSLPVRPKVAPLRHPARPQQTHDVSHTGERRTHVLSACPSLSLATNVMDGDLRLGRDPQFFTTCNTKRN